MKSRNYLPLFQFCFVVLLMAVFLGWLVVILELVQRDAEIFEARVKEAEERYLNELVRKFESYHEGEVEEWSGVDGTMVNVGGAFHRGVTGVWSPRFVKKEVSEPQDRILSELPLVNSSEDILKHQKDLVWGEVVDGRDRVGSLVLKIAKKEGDDFKAVDFLEEGVLNYTESGYAMSPGFRLLLIAELEKHTDYDWLPRLKFAERIRAVEGRVDELSGGLELWVMKKGDLSFFYTRSELLDRLGSEEIEISEARLEDRASVKIEGLNGGSYLGFKSGHFLEKEAETQSKMAIYLVGLCTLISTIGLVFTAIWMGRRQLQQARARTDLAASVAHELRTPLAGQRIVLESMLAKEKFDESYLKMALRENERLGDLSEEFLTFSRLERGVLELQLEPLSLSESVESVVSDFSAQHDGEKVAFESEGEVEALADSAGVATIVRNLLENAWKYSEEPRWIEVEVFDRGGEVGFSVADAGVGLSASEQKRIFGQFYRVEQKLSRSQDGLGIGLSIVKRLVDAMEGRIEVESEKGHGSTFTVFLKRGGVA